MCIDDDDEDRSPRFGDDDDEMDERGGWYRSRLPLYAKQRFGGATLLPQLDGDGRHPLFESDLPDDDGWHHPRPHFPLGAQQAVHSPIWQDLACLEALGGATWHKPYKS